jgi:ABC-type phosphate transport system substrate-binding protein
VTKLFRAFFLICGFLVLMAEVHAQVIVIANPSVKSSDISKNDLRDVFIGATSSLKDRSLVTPILLKAGPATNEFLAAYVGKSDSAFRASWRSMVFSGQASMPKSLDSEAAVVEFVAHNPGAIGYISKAAPHNGVKVLAIR